LQAVALAGGVSDTGNPDRVHVVRTGDRSQVNDVVVSLPNIQAGSSADPALFGGDIVVIEQSNAKLAFSNIKELLPFSAMSVVAR